MTREDSNVTPLCGGREPDLLLLAYGDLEAPEREALERHVRSCPVCSRSLATLRDTLSTVNGAALREMATVEAPGDWPALRSSLGAARPARAGLPFWAKAAAVLLVAGASFAVGRLWAPAGGQSARSQGADRTGEPISGDSSVQIFSRRTNDYLDRSRLVLLELANGDVGDGSLSLSEASRTLLDENPAAREVAREIADRRLQDLVAELETILGQISRLPEGDAARVDRIRTYLDNSGLLDQLELLSAVPDRLNRDRSRT